MIVQFFLPGPRTMTCRYGMGYVKAAHSIMMFALRAT